MSGHGKKRRKQKKHPNKKIQAHSPTPPSDFLLQAASSLLFGVSIRVIISLSLSTSDALLIVQVSQAALVLRIATGRRAQKNGGRAVGHLRDKRHQKTHNTRIYSHALTIASES
jgi:hypothetical protein